MAPSQAELVQVADSPVFDGLDLSTFGYWYNENYAHPVLAEGAQLLATDGNGVNMIALNGSQDVMGVNICARIA